MTDTMTLHFDLAGEGIVATVTDRRGAFADLRRMKFGKGWTVYSILRREIETANFRSWPTTEPEKT